MKRIVKAMNILLFEFAELSDKGKVEIQKVESTGLTQYFFKEQHIYFTEEMFKWCGKECEFAERLDGKYRLAEDTAHFEFTFLEEWLEPIKEENVSASPNELKVGDVVKVKSREEILNMLEAQGYSECITGSWRKRWHVTFYNCMFNYTELELKVLDIDFDKILLSINNDDKDWFHYSWITKV